MTKICSFINAQIQSCLNVRQERGIVPLPHDSFTSPPGLVAKSLCPLAVSNQSLFEVTGVLLITQSSFSLSFSNSPGDRGTLSANSYSQYAVIIYGSRPSLHASSRDNSPSEMYRFERTIAIVVSTLLGNCIYSNDL